MTAVVELTVDVVAAVVVDVNSALVVSDSLGVVGVELVSSPNTLLVKISTATRLRVNFFILFF